MVVLIALYALRAQRELSLVVEDNLTQERAVLTSTPPSSPKPARLPPSSQSLPLLTPVVQPAQKPRSHRDASVQQGGCTALLNNPLTTCRWT